MPPPTTATRIWDLPTRAFHWLLAANVVGSVASAKAGWMQWHAWFGEAALTLLLFRLVWGLVGGHWSRWRAMLFAPRVTWAYLRGRGQAADEVGHSPLGVLSVLAMLAVLAAQAATGLVADDEIATTGPLVALVSSATSLAATAWHKGTGQALLLVLVALHVAAVAWHTRRGKPLLKAMVHGDKPLPGATPASRDDAATRALALVLVLVCAGIVRWIVSLGALPG